MPIQWRPFRRTQTGPQFLTCPPNRFVWFCSSPEQHTIVDLHFLPAGKGSLPCMGEECMLCQRPPETHTYTVVLWTPSISHPRWTPGIIDIGRPDKEIAQTDYRGKCLEVGRAVTSDKQTGLLVKRELLLPDTHKPRVTVHRDAKPYLMRRWNIKETEEFFAPREDGSQGRLFGDGNQSGE